MKLQFGEKEIDVAAFNLNQLIDLEKKFGGLSQFKGELPLEVMRYAAWLVVRDVIPGISEMEVGSKMNMASIAQMPGIVRAGTVGK